MARQSTTPVQFNRSRRIDEGVLLSSGRAGVVQPVCYAPILKGDSASGAINVALDLAEMPKPLLNGAMLNVQAWYVDKSAHPQFAGQEEMMHSYVGQAITTLGAADRTPPPFFNTLEGAAADAVTSSDFFKKLGIHGVGTAYANINTDLLDAFSLIYNFRLAAHSSRLARRKYSTEDAAEATSLPRAFWPTGRFSRVVPDYERALIVGNLDFDVAAGSVPLKSVGTAQAFQPAHNQFPTSDSTVPPPVDANGYFDWNGEVWADMTGQTIGMTLADLDKARELQSFAKMRAAMAGNDPTGFVSDEVVLAELMRGFAVPQNMLDRPILLDSKRVPFNFIERHATDAANLDDSVSTGNASVSLRINLPKMDNGGMIICTVEVVPERLYERQGDPFLGITTPSELPDALRDTLRDEPVDLVTNDRVDAAHTIPAGLYGYEPMNDVWNRSYTRLGGEYYQATPGNSWTENRSAIWQAEVIDPVLSDDHWLVPASFPHYVFSDTLGDAFDVTCRHQLQISGLTQFGDVLMENSDDYTEIAADIA